MPKVKNVERKIWDTEGFDVEFRYIHNGRDIRGEKDGLPQYLYSKAAKNDMTVNEWKLIRFSKTYPGYHVVVRDGDGGEVPNQTKLGTVRDTYTEDEGGTENNY